MSINLDIQEKISAFLPEAIEKAIDIYQKQKEEGFKCDHNETDPIISFDTYFSRLKVCVGQIDILFKLATLCSKNNLLSDSQQEKLEVQKQEIISLKSAQNDVIHHLKYNHSEMIIEDIHDDSKIVD
jgi:hypothetical protein